MRPGRAGQRYDRAVMRARALAARIALAAGAGLIAAPLVAIAGSSASQQSPAPGATSAPASKVADRAVGTRHRRLRARLRAIPAAVPAGSAVLLDASRSKARGARIVAYRWDLDGNGSFETSTGSRAHVRRVIAKAGTVRVGVKVLDDRGDSSVRRIKVTGLTRPRPERSSGVIRRGPRLDGGTVRAIRRDVSFAPARPAGRTAASTIAPLHAASSSSVSIHDFKFNPSSITIHVGDTVTWTNQDSQQHTATATDGTFNTGTLNHGDVGRFTFPRAGTFNYTCKFHPFMKASVTVVGSSSNGSSSGGSSGSGSSGGSSPGSGSSSGGTSSSSSSNPLPHTGLQVISLVIAALALLGSGLVLRRGVRYPTEPPA